MTITQFNELRKTEGKPPLESRREIVIGEWPMWAKTLAKLALPTDRGIGDTVQRLIGRENGLAFKRWFKSTFGKDCGCAGRQAKWNQLYPL